MKEVSSLETAYFVEALSTRSIFEVTVFTKLFIKKGKWSIKIEKYLEIFNLFDPEKRNIEL